MWRETVILSLVVLGGVGIGCSSKSDSSGSQDVDCGIAVDRFKELMIVDESVISDSRARNDVNGPWSFRHVVESAMPDDGDTSASDFVTGWLNDWGATTEVNGFATDPQPQNAGKSDRVEQINALLICPWLQRSPSNGCDAECKTCDKRVLNMAAAPFRLTAIVNRTDLRIRPDATSPAGEARFIFALTQGPGDDPASTVSPMSLIFEYALPDTKTPKGWVDAWHHLSSHTDFGDAFNAELESFTEQFVARGVSPSRVNGSALSQVRTNESTFNWVWQLRQFHLNPAGDLRLAPVSNTPGSTLNNSQTLHDFATQNRDKILTNQSVLPTSLLAGSANQLLGRWDIPGVDEPLRAAFARATCNGCHSGENPAIDLAFHVSPYRKGLDKLSLFVNNPKDPKHDELGRREQLMERLLCQ